MRDKLLARRAELAVRRAPGAEPLVGLRVYRRHWTLEPAVRDAEARCAQASARHDRGARWARQGSSAVAAWNRYRFAPERPAQAYVFWLPWGAVFEWLRDRSSARAAVPADARRRP